MRKRKPDQITCPNQSCDRGGGRERTKIVPHGHTKTRWGRRRRYRCTACGRTFSATTGTPYSRLQYSSRAFDRVAALSVEGVSKAGRQRHP